MCGPMCRAGPFPSGPSWATNCAVRWWSEAPGLVRKGGQVVLAGFCDQDVPINPHTLVMRAVELKAVLGYHDDFGDVVRFLARRPFDPRELITAVLPLEDAAGGFRRVLEDPQSIRVLLQP